ncbi:GGDEF domain-containing protein [Actinophytocola sediminis]
MTPAVVRGGLLALPAGAAVYAGVAVPIGASDLARAGVLLAAALVTTELMRRTHAVRHDDVEPRASLTVISVWSVAAAVAVPLTLAVALVLVLCAYRDLRGEHDARHTFISNAGTIAWALLAAHFVASSGAWTTPSPHIDTGGVLLLAAAAAAHLVVNSAFAAAGHVLREGRVSRAAFGRGADIGLEAALLSIGAITGVLLTGSLVVVAVAVPVVVTLCGAATTQHLEGAAFVDQKTGLANAASWQAYADRVAAELAGDRCEIGVLMVDLDRFKRLNDTYGHRAGDDVLAAVGECLRSQLRQGDLGGRFGGEEFTVLLPDANVIDTLAVAERIRAAIAALRVSTVDKNGAQVVVSEVTASIGAAAYPHHGATIQDCLRVADHYAYQAKHQGRNRVAGIDTENITSMRTSSAG